MEYCQLNISGIVYCKEGIRSCPYFVTGVYVYQGKTGKVYYACNDYEMMEDKKSLENKVCPEKK